MIKVLWWITYDLWIHLLRDIRMKYLTKDLEKFRSNIELNIANGKWIIFIEHNITKYEIESWFLALKKIIMSIWQQASSNEELRNHQPFQYQETTCVHKSEQVLVFQQDLRDILKIKQRNSTIY